MASFRASFHGGHGGRAAGYVLTTFNEVNKKINSKNSLHVKRNYVDLWKGQESIA
jgi:hypothetical protein